MDIHTSDYDNRVLPYGMKYLGEISRVIWQMSLMGTWPFRAGCLFTLSLFTSLVRLAAVESRVESPPISVMATYMPHTIYYMHNTCMWKTTIPPLVTLIVRKYFHKIQVSLNLWKLQFWEFKKTWNWIYEQTEAQEFQTIGLTIFSSI